MSNEITINHKNSNELILNQGAMSNILMFAQEMAKGTVTVPKHLQGNASDCLAITMQAVQWGMSPFVVAQKTHVVSGNLGYEAQLVNAVVVNSGAIDGRFHYQYGGNWPSGSDAWVMCGAVLAGETEIQWGEPLYPSNVTTKNSPLWKTNPKQQGAYLAVKYWARMYCPGAIMGVYSTDELEQPPERDITPQAESASPLDSLMQEVDAGAINTESTDITDFLVAFEEVGGLEEYASLVEEVKAAGGGLTESQQAEIQAANRTAKARLKAASAKPNFDID